MTEPYTKVAKVFPAVDSAIRSHERLAATVMKLAGKVAKMSGADPARQARAEREHSRAERDWRRESRQLAYELPRLYALRADLADPCARALAEAQVVYCTEVARILDGV